jgi:hypothetical protein
LLEQRPAGQSNVGSDLAQVTLLAPSGPLKTTSGAVAIGPELDIRSLSIA